MAGLQSIFAGFFKTEVLIYARTSVSNDYSDDDDSFAAPFSVMGWMRNQPDTQLVMAGGAVQAPQTGRLHLPVGTVVDRGDKVSVAGEDWTIIDYNTENTYKVSLRVAIERLD